MTQGNWSHQYHWLMESDCLYVSQLCVCVCVCVCVCMHVCVCGRVWVHMSI